MDLERTTKLIVNTMYNVSSGKSGTLLSALHRIPSLANIVLGRWVQVGEGSEDGEEWMDGRGS